MWEGRGGVRGVRVSKLCKGQQEELLLLRGAGMGLESRSSTTINASTVFEFAVEAYDRFTRESKLRFELSA